jgi:hypothetical protein
MNQRVTVETLVEELRSLAGVTSSVKHMIDDDVDWLIPTDSMDNDAQSVLMQMGGRRNVSEAATVDAASRETVKGSLETLAKRMEGIIDMVDIGKQSSVFTALEKVIKDSQTLLDTLESGQKKAETQEKKEKSQKQDPQEPKSQEDQKADAKDTKGSQGQSPKQGEGTYSRGAPQAPLQQGGEAKTPASEGLIIVGSDVISESSLTDPFGMGAEFKADIMKMSIPGKKVN